MEPRSAPGLFGEAFKSGAWPADAEERPGLRDLSPLRRVLHLIWEMVWRYEIVWDSEEHPKQKARSVFHGENCGGQNELANGSGYRPKKEKSVTSRGTGDRPYLLETPRAREAKIVSSSR